MVAQALSTSTADRTQSLEPGSRVRPHCATSPHAALNEFSPRLLQHLPDLFTRGGGRTLGVRCLETADRYDGDMRPAGEFLLLDAEQGTGGTDLLRGDFHDRI
jgi:hypothetical protein